MPHRAPVEDLDDQGSAGLRAPDIAVPLEPAHPSTDGPQGVPHVAADGLVLPDEQA